MKTHILLFLFLTSITHLKSQNLKFNHLSNTEGLSSNRAFDIIQDYKGFLWIGTDYGLNRYDGYNVEIFLSDENDKFSINGNEVHVLFEDSKKRLWIGTYGKGLCYYDEKNNHFIRFEEFQDCAISNFFEDDEQNLWIIAENCIGSYNLNTGQFINYSDKFNLSGIGDLAYSSNPNEFWLGSETSGLYLLNVKNKTVKSFPHLKSALSSQRINGLYQDSHGILWIGYYEKGLLDCLNTQTMEVEHFSRKENNINGVPKHPVEAFFEISDEIWIGTQNGGIAVYNRSSATFKNYIQEVNNPNSISNNSIAAVGKGFYQDRQGRVWIATSFGGVNVVDKYVSKFSEFPIPLPSPTVNAIFRDSKKRLWIGTEKGVTKIENGISKTYLNFPILAIEEDSKGQIWLGSWTSGMSIFQEQQDKFIQFLGPEELHNITFDFVSTDDDLFAISYQGILKMDIDEIEIKEEYVLFCSDSIPLKLEHALLIGNEIFVGGINTGLLVFNINTKETNCYQFEANNPKSISGNFVNSIFQDSKNRIWIGTKEGLNLMEERGSFKRFTINDGLANSAIQSILEDAKGELWVSTTKGLSHFNPENNTFKNYDINDGLTSNQFRYNSSFSDNNGYLYFGGVKGLDYFNPDSIKYNPHKPQVYITNLKVFNKPVEIAAADSILNENIINIKEITLDYTQSVFSLEFVGLNFTNPDKNQYAYMLEGLENDWNYVGNQRNATYTNLDAGTYTFKIKASNNENVWNEEGTQLIINILPPWWETWTFRLVTGFILISTVFGYFRVRTKQLKNRNKNLELKVQERTIEIQEKQNEILTQNEELIQTQEELETQRDYIEQRNHELLQKNQHINQSIKAAEAIQIAFLPSEQNFEKAFSKHFIFFRPRDVVSGDFYWLNEQNNEIWLAVADCTGHGVPGAFMTMLGKSLLDQIVDQIKVDNPAQALKELDEMVRYSLRQKETKNASGMDLILIKITKGEQVKIEYAGAKNPLYKVNSKGELLKYHGDRISIGSIKTTPVHFTNQLIEVEKGDQLFLSTDGYKDQNDLHRKSFKTKRLEQLFMDISIEKSYTKKHKLLAKTLDTHMVGTTQRDDILVVGIEI